MVDAKTQVLSKKDSTAAAESHESLANRYPIIWFIGALIGAFVWLGGTSVQIWTSEMWISGENTKTSLLEPHFSVLGQFYLFWSGGLTHLQVISYSFALGVQAALIFFSVGLELPKHTKSARNRATLFAWCCVLLIAVNCLGDFFYALDMGVWAAVGFTGTIFFMTFCVGLLTIMALIHGIAAYRVAGAK